jgi:hypothetical protein
MIFPCQSLRLSLCSGGDTRVIGEDRKTRRCSLNEYRVVYPYATVKLVPSVLSGDGCARMGPVLLPTMVIATSVNALIEPLTPPIVAELALKDADPKFASVVNLQTAPVHNAGLSTIHSAEVCCAFETVPGVVDVAPVVVSVIVAVNTPLPDVLTDAVIALFGLTVMLPIVTIGFG